jgi:hypothetical protein
VLLLGTSALQEVLPNGEGMASGPHHGTMGQHMDLSASHYLYL